MDDLQMRETTYSIYLFFFSWYYVDVLYIRPFPYIGNDIRELLFLFL